MNFSIAINRVLGNEGGYVNNPNDPGGETNWGISKRSYPEVDIKALTRDDAVAIYLRDFWQRGQMDQFDGAIAYQALDFAVNSGIETAIRKLQAAVGVAEDGHVGPVTVAAINAIPVPEVLGLFIAERLYFWTTCANWQFAGKGWARRAVADIRYAITDWKNEPAKLI